MFVHCERNWYQVLTVAALVARNANEDTMVFIVGSGGVCVWREYGASRLAYCWCVCQEYLASVFVKMFPHLIHKGKAIPLHAMEAFGGRGGIAPTHSRPRHLMGVSGQRHAPAALLPPGERTPGTHWTGGWVGPRAGLDTEATGKILCPCRESNPDRPIVQPVDFIYKDFYKCILNKLYKADAAVNCITLRRKKGSFPWTLTLIS
jgi:hypothetical protein